MNGTVTPLVILLTLNKEQWDCIRCTASKKSASKRLLVKSLNSRRGVKFGAPGGIRTPNLLIRSYLHAPFTQTDPALEGTR